MGLGVGFAALNFGAKLTGAKAALAKVPAWLWYALVAAVLLIGSYFYHQHRVHSHDKALVKATIEQRDQQWTKRLAAEHSAALAWKGRFDADVAAKIKLQRKLTDEENSRIAADRADLRLRGPGQAAAAASCRPIDHSRLAGIASGHDAKPGSAADAGTQVPASDGQDQWAIVPWNWLVDVVSEHDAYRVEALGWRSRDAMLAGIWKRAQQQPPPSK